MPKAFTALSIALICFLSASLVSGEVGSRSDRIILAKKNSHSTASHTSPPTQKPSADPATESSGSGAPRFEKVSDDTVILPQRGEFNLLARDPLDMLKLDNIKPLYTSPALQGEGVWESSGSPRDSGGRPLVYKTFYRPSVDFPNAVVYMMVIDMSMTSIQYYVGSQ
ncbi:MAG: hypothetical protein V1897_01285, partial [Pseudomonadota bacterium]